MCPHPKIFKPFARKLNDADQAGLLAYLIGWPSRTSSVQWRGVADTYMEAYSYGDSAGSAPDFPINPLDKRGT